MDVLGFTLVTRDHYPAGGFLDNVVGLVGAELTLAMGGSAGRALIGTGSAIRPTSNRQVFKPRACSHGFRPPGLSYR